MYKSFEKGFISNVIDNWDIILKDNTTNLSNFKEVLEKQGIYTKVEASKKQIFFSKENNFTGDNKKVVSLYRIAGILDSQFKNAKEKNFFDYDLSIKILLDKELELSKRKKLEKEYNFSNIREKKDPVKELELKLNKELVKKGIEDYKNNIDKQMQDYFKISEFGKTEREKEHFNIRYKEENGYFFNKVKDFMLDEMAKDVKTECINKATANYLKETFKNLTSDYTVEELQNSKIVIDNATIEILKDKFYKVPTTKDIEKANLEELKKMQKDISKNMEKSQEEIKNFFEELPAFKKKKELENNINTMLGTWDKDSSLGIALDNIYTYIKKEFIEYTKDKDLEDKELNEYRLELKNPRETWYWDTSSDEEEREEEKEEVKKKEEEKVVTVKPKPRKSVLEEALEATIKDKEKLLREQREQQEKEELEKSTNKKDKEVKKGYDHEY